MSLLHRLNLAQKFLVLGLIALLMVIAPSALYFKRTVAEIDLAQRELRGSGPLMALNKVIQLTQSHRGLSAGMLSGNEGLALRRPAMRDAVVKAMNALDAELGVSGVSSGSQTHWNELRQRWVTLEKRVDSRQVSAAESTKLHTQLIAGELLLTEDLLNEFALARDPDVDTYSLMRASLVDMPALAENLGVMRALGSGFLTQGNLPPEGRATLQALKKRVLELQDDMFRNLKIATSTNPYMSATLEADAQNSQTAVDKTLALAEQELIGAAEIKLLATDYFDEFTRTIDGLYNFNALAMKDLVGGIEARVAQVRRVESLVLAALLLGLAVASALAVVFVRSIAGPVTEAVAVARAVADGNLRVDVPVRGNNEFGQLMQALATMRDNLARVVSQVLHGSESVASASAQIEQGNIDLSSRTEEEASALEQTSAAIEELGVTVHHNAEKARQANQLAQASSAVAVRGGEVVAKVVHTMKDINESSRKISDIINVIDSIAFQTNILALNAAVEAARAGEQGRGFAVVASEVRSLAQRSAEAAKEIKTLISTSVERVDQGTALVDQAGATMQEVVNSIRRVTEIMGEIAAASVEQSTAVAQVVEAVAQIDQTTQQNAALVEEGAAAAGSLRAEAEELLHTVAGFQV